MLHLHLREALSCYNADVLLRMLLVWRILLKMFMLSNNCMKVGKDHTDVYLPAFGPCKRMHGKSKQ